MNKKNGVDLTEQERTTLLRRQHLPNATNIMKAAQKVYEATGQTWALCDVLWSMDLRRREFGEMLEAAEVDATTGDVGTEKIDSASATTNVPHTPDIFCEPDEDGLTPTSYLKQKNMVVLPDWLFDALRQKLTDLALEELNEPTGIGPHSNKGARMVADRKKFLRYLKVQQEIEKGASKQKAYEAAINSSQGHFAEANSVKTIRDSYDEVRDSLAEGGTRFFVPAMPELRRLMFRQALKAKKENTELKFKKKTNASDKGSKSST